MKRYTAKVVTSDGTTYHDTIEAAWVHAVKAGGGSIYRAVDKTKGGRWALVQEVIPA